MKTASDISGKALPLRLRAFDQDEPVTVSICTIAFNHATFIAQAIESFLDQEAPFRIEIIIYDDASTDSTADIVRSYAEKHPTIIRPILSDRNMFSLGVKPREALVFPEARGEFIAICDGDDYWTEPEKLAKQVRVLRSDPSIAITYGRIFGDLGEGKTIDYFAGLERDTTPEELKTSSAINTATTCFRNPFLKAPPPFLRNSPIGDQTVWAIVGGMGRGRYMEDLAPVGYRIHEGGIHSTKTTSTRYYMALVAKTCIAAYHANERDSASERRVLEQTVRVLTAKMGLRRVILHATRSWIGQSLGAAKRWFQKT